MQIYSFMCNVSINLKSGPQVLYNITAQWNNTLLTPWNRTDNWTYNVKNFSLIPSESRGIPFGIELEQLQGEPSYTFGYTIQLYVEGVLIEEYPTLYVIVYP